MDAWALGETIDLVEEAQLLRPELKARVLITRMMSRTSIGRSARHVLAEGGLPMMHTELGYRVAYQESPAAGLGVVHYNSTDKSASEIRQLAQEIEGLFTDAREVTHVA